MDDLETMWNMIEDLEDGTTDNIAIAMSRADRLLKKWTAKWDVVRCDTCNIPLHPDYAHSDRNQTVCDEKCFRDEYM